MVSFCAPPESNTFISKVYPGEDSDPAEFIRTADPVTIFDPPPIVPDRASPPSLT